MRNSDESSGCALVNGVSSADSGGAMRVNAASGGKKKPPPLVLASVELERRQHAVAGRREARVQFERLSVGLTRNEEDFVSRPEILMALQ